MSWKTGWSHNVDLLKPCRRKSNYLQTTQSSSLKKDHSTRSDRMMYSLLFTIIVLLGLSSFSSAAAFAASGRTNLMGVNQGSSPLFRRSSHRPEFMIPRGGELEVEDVDVPSMETEPVTELKSTTSTATTTASAAAVTPSVIGKTMAVLTTFGAKYSQQLELRPIITKSYTAGLIFGLSDFFAQKIERSNDANGTSGDIDWIRTLASTLVGLLYFGPAAHYWYEWIFRLLPATTLVSTMHKAFWGQGKIFVFAMTRGRFETNEDLAISHSHPVYIPF